MDSQTPKGMPIPFQGDQPGTHASPAATRPSLNSEGVEFAKWSTAGTPWSQSGRLQNTPRLVKNRRESLVSLLFSQLSRTPAIRVGRSVNDVGNYPIRR